MTLQKWAGRFGWGIGIFKGAWVAFFGLGFGLLGSFLCLSCWDCGLVKRFSVCLYSIGFRCVWGLYCWGS